MRPNIDRSSRAWPRLIMPKEQVSRTHATPDLIPQPRSTFLRVSTRIQPKSHIYALLWKKMQNKKLFWDAKQTKTTQTLNILDSLSDITRTVIATVLIVTTTTHMRSIWIDERWTPRFGIAIYCGARSVLHSQEREREDAVITRSIWWWCFCIISKAGHDNYFVQIQLTSYTRRSKHFIFFANLIVFCFSSPL